MGTNHRATELPARPSKDSFLDLLIFYIPYLYKLVFNNNKIPSIKSCFSAFFLPNAGDKKSEVFK